MTEQEFFNYSLFVQDQRFYHPNWAYVVFRAKYGKWVNKSQKQNAVPTEPIESYLHWLDDHLKQWSETKNAS